MKAILEFNLPEDNTDFKLASKAYWWYSVVWDLDQELRAYLKYGHDFKDADEVLEKIRETLNELVTEKNISFDEIG